MTSPARTIVDSRGLWSLWDMLSHWGYIYFVFGTELAYAEAELERYRATQSKMVITGLNPEWIDPEHRVAIAVAEKCEAVLRISDDAKQELGPIPANVDILKAKILAAKRRIPKTPLLVSELLDDIRRIQNDFRIVLESRLFYHLRPEAARLYGDPELFGETVARKFKDARDDIERAGNCLALGEPTACVLHLLRAMESAIRRLGTRLNVTINPKDTWGMILKNMDHGIQALPEANEKEKRKKSQWSECRVNLFHVKMAWRDDTMHGKASYDEKQARDILERVKSFMQHLAML